MVVRDGHQDILVAAADERGEWSLPLPPAQLESMEKVRRPSLHASGPRVSVWHIRQSIQQHLHVCCMRLMRL